MHYNNSCCRLAVRRSPAGAPPETPRKALPKKGRKAAPRRVLAVASLTVLLFVGGLEAVSAAETTDYSADAFHFVSVPETVAFTGFTGRLTLDRLGDGRAQEDELADRLDAFTAQVNALTTHSLQAMAPVHPTRLSTLTVALLSAGLGIAVVRMGLFFRSDFAR